MAPPRLVRRLAVGLALVPLLAAGPLAAQATNLIPNGRFDDADELAGWTTSFDGGEMEWEELQDDDFCPASGSASITSVVDLDSGTVHFNTCIPNGIEAGDSYLLAGSFWFRDGFADGAAQTHPSFYDQDDCTGTILPSPGFFAGIADPHVSNWQRFQKVAAAPANAKSARIFLMLVKAEAADPQINVLADDLFFGPSEYVFADDFEVGLDCRWAYSTNDDL